MIVLRYDSQFGGMRPNSFKLVRISDRVATLEVAVQTTDVAHVYRGLTMRVQRNHRGVSREAGALLISQITDAWQVEPARLHADLPMTAFTLVGLPDPLVPPA